jgi:V-type H+-transporting ATPase subunit a
MKLVDPHGSYGRSRTIKEMDELEGTLNDLEGRISQMNSSYLTLNNRFLELTEMRYVLRETSVLFEEVY